MLLPTTGPRSISAGDSRCLRAARNRLNALVEIAFSPALAAFALFALVVAPLLVGVCGRAESPPFVRLPPRRARNPDSARLDACSTVHPLMLTLQLSPLPDERKPRQRLR